MSSWETQVTNSTHDAKASLNAQMEGRQRDTSSTKGLNFGGYNQHNGTLGGIIKGATIGGFTAKNPVLGGIVGGVIGHSQISGYDMVGIVGSQVEPMRQSVRDYVNNVQTVAGQAIEHATDGMNDAFRGKQAQAAVEAYLNKVREYINNLSSQLLSFSDKLADVGNAWKRAQEEIAGNVNVSTGSFSEGTAYSDNITYTED